MVLLSHDLQKDSEQSLLNQWLSYLSSAVFKISQLPSGATHGITGQIIRDGTMDYLYHQSDKRIEFFPRNKS